MALVCSSRMCIEGSTYRAAFRVAIGEVAAGDRALLAAIDRYRHRIGKHGAAGRPIWLEADPRDATLILRNTQDKGSPVAHIGPRVAPPDASLFLIKTHWVDIVLRRSLLALPNVGLGLHRVRDLYRGSRLSDERDNHILGSAVVGTARGDDLGEVVLDGDAPGALLTESLDARPTQLKEPALVAPKAAN